MYKVKSELQAWYKVHELSPLTYVKSESDTIRAGYDVYRAQEDGHYYDYVCDLGDHLELNTSDGNTHNIWFNCEKPAPVMRRIYDANNIKYYAYNLSAYPTIAEMVSDLSAICEKYQVKNVYAIADVIAAVINNVQADSKCADELQRLLDDCELFGNVGLYELDYRMRLSESLARGVVHYDI